MGLATENNELMLRLQVMEQQAHLHDGKHYFYCSRNTKSTFFYI